LADLSWQITPISMVFVYLVSFSMQLCCLFGCMMTLTSDFRRYTSQEDNCKKAYSMVKMMSQFQFGIPSQCCVHGKYSATRSKEQ
jgi:hypothetical protein